MPIKLEHLGGARRPKGRLMLNGQTKAAPIKNGTRVKFGSEFKTGSGHTYPAGSEGVKTGSYSWGLLVTMADGKTLTVPTHLHTVIPCN